MQFIKSLGLLTLVVGLSQVVAPKGHAQISVSVGTAPACPYGYYDYQPYACAPYGYYGPEWFSNGVFVGAGPWFHGPEHFRGHVDNHYDVHSGYPGAMPARGEKVVEHPHYDFHGNEYRDGHGHSYKDNK